MNNPTQTYFLYCRKSSEDDGRQVLSIDSQIGTLTDLAASQGIAISRTFSESKSAKEPGRDKFNDMLVRIEKGEANGIVHGHWSFFVSTFTLQWGNSQETARGKAKPLKFQGFSNCIIHRGLRVIHRIPISSSYASRRSLAKSWKSTLANGGFGFSGGGTSVILM